MKIQIEEKKPIDVPSEWCPFDGAKFLIAGTSKPAFGRKMEIFSAKINQELNGYREITDESAQLTPLDYNKAFADLILDWEGVIDADGKPIKYSADMAEQLCTMAIDPETKQGLSMALVLFVSEQAELIQASAGKAKEELLGKSLSATDINCMALKPNIKNVSSQRSVSKRKRRK
ncbi:hypothetical protein [Acinetobacter rudis]|uniref:Tail assembly chaperone n=1 Tax=Acinetobacter rudis CIP 110305 TaxID=421052 RepID=S3NYB7_9GAMM|nr:hypothetical protein [Acinetobacter rudis]EPF71616.1 hypothetical protein F945_02649 [Acinetobacter rudis CIP 110305]